MTQTVNTTLLTFTLDGNRFAVEAACVREVIRAVAVTPLPGAPAVVAGVIDVRGDTVPVFDARLRFGFAARSIAPDDRFVLVDTGERRAALRVDATGWLADVPRSAVQPVPVAAGSPHVAGTVALEDGLVVIHDVGTFLSAAESESLDAALAGAERAAARSPAR